MKLSKRLNKTKQPRTPVCTHTHTLWHMSLGLLERVQAQPLLCPDTAELRVEGCSGPFCLMGEVAGKCCCSE